MGAISEGVRRAIEAGEFGPVGPSPLDSGSRSYQAWLYHNGAGVPSRQRELIDGPVVRDLEGAAQHDPEIAELFYMWRRGQFVSFEAMLLTLVFRLLHRSRRLQSALQEKELGTVSLIKDIEIKIDPAKLWSMPPELRTAGQEGASPPVGLHNVGRVPFQATPVVEALRRYRERLDRPSDVTRLAQSGGTPHVVTMSESAPVVDPDAPCDYCQSTRVCVPFVGPSGPCPRCRPAPESAGV